MMDGIKRTQIDESSLDQLLGLDSSKIGYYAEVKQKIRELETANLTLRAKKSELQAVFDAISDGVVIYTSEGIVQHRNRVCPQLFAEQTLIGKACSELFHPEREKHPNYCPVERALEGENAHTTFTSMKNPGETRYFDVTATPIHDPRGTPRALLFLRDVTEKRLQELHLVQAEKMSSIGLLAAGVAHEINNPLTSVAGYAEALLRRFREDEGLAGDSRLEVFKSYLEVIMRESYRCKGIIDSLLSFSRKSEGSFGRVDLNLLITEVLDLVGHRARHENIRIDFRPEPELPAILGDASALRQVFLNLTMNALQAVEDKGGVAVATTADGDMAIVQVEDTGCGIPEELLDQIWDPFFTTKTVGQGLGLGLAITYNIVKRHEGEVEVLSRRGEGCKFTVRLPTCQP